MSKARLFPSEIVSDGHPVLVAGPSDEREIEVRSAEYRNVEGAGGTAGLHARRALGARRLVFAAGAVPIDEAGNLVGENDVVAQAEYVIANLLKQLEAGGASAQDVVKTTVYVAGGSHEAQSAVWQAVQRSSIAAAPSTLLGVALLGYRGQLVEIEAVAVID